MTSMKCSKSTIQHGGLWSLTTTLLIVGFMGRPVAVADEPPGVNERWQVMYVGEQRIGYGRSTWERFERDRQVLIRTTDEIHLKMKRFGDDFEMHVKSEYVDDESGTMDSFRVEFWDDPRRVTRTVGQVENGRLKVLIEVGTKKRESTPDWTPRTRSPAFEQHLFRTALREPGDRQLFDVFRPELNRTSKVSVGAIRRTRTTLLDGSDQELLEVQTVDPLLPTVRSFLDPIGNLVKSESDFLGNVLTTYVVSEAEAVRAITGAELDQAGASLIPLKTQIRHPERTVEIRFRIHSHNGQLMRSLPLVNTQSVKSIDGETIELTVRRPQAPSRATSVVIDDESLVEPTQYLNSDDYYVRDHARKAAAGRVDPWKACLLAERYVFEKLKDKNFSTALATAAEVARSMEGDCTEHAVLLAAMLRVYRIPSRVAAGLVYIERQGFPYLAGHMWTEARIGDQWVPLDATTGRGGVSAAYIKLADSTLADDGPLPATIFLPLLNWFQDAEISVMSVR